MRPRRVTAVLALAAVTAVSLASFDRPPSAGTSLAVPAQRLLPELAEIGAEIATVTLERTGEPTVVLRPSRGGHAVLVDGDVRGPADPDAVDGLWQSLRLATAVREVPNGADVDPVRRARIAITLDDGEIVLRLGSDASDGSGVYGVVDGPDPRRVVIEAEVAALVDAAPDSWVLRRLSALDPRHLESMRFGELAVERDADGLWRGAKGELWDTAYVETRLRTLVDAPFEPVGNGAVDVETSLRPWLKLDGPGTSESFRIGRACPGRDDAVVAERGPGALGCIPARLAGPPQMRPEPRLAPHAYGRILSVTQTRPRRRTLRRQGGGWLLADGDRADAVAESEVYRWYASVHEATVVDAAVEPVGEPTVTIRLTTDAGTALALSCGGGEPPTWCRRDEGTAWRVRGFHQAMGFDATTFADRGLLDLAAGEATAIEWIAADAGRRSVRLDLGVWVLDAPDPVPTGEVLRTRRVDELLAALISLRARDWVEPPNDVPLVQIAIDRPPRRDRSPRLTLALHPGCVILVEGSDRGARVARPECETLQRDLVTREDPADSSSDGSSDR